MTMTHTQAVKAPVTWTLVADSARARLFETRGQSELDEIEILTNPAARAHDADLVTDGPGRMAGGRGTGHGSSTEARDDASGHETERFAKQIAEHLRVSLAQNRYAQLRVVASPEFLGRLRRSFDSTVTNAVSDTVAHDYTRLSGADLSSRLAAPAPLS
ncbi:hypothetical protein BH09PSE6_BH09PSE6_07870 [soil metagenome]